MQTKHFQFITEKIGAAQSSASKLAQGLGHVGIEGQIREIAAKECIEPFLTHSFQCASGKIIDTRQTLSSQIDLLVYHRRLAPPILLSRDLGLFPVECVKYAFEIKTTVTATGIKDANEKFRSVFALKPFPGKRADGSETQGSSPSTVLLAFGSDIKGSEIERYMAYTAEEYPCPCSVLCVLGKGYWFHDYKERKWYGIDTQTWSPKFWEFCMFISGFMNSLANEEATTRAFSPGGYVATNDFSFLKIPDPLAASKKYEP